MGIRALASLVLVASMAASMGCAGALWSDSDGKALLPISFGNAEFVNDSTCVSGGPISEGLVGLVGSAVQMALSVFRGDSVKGDDGSQDTPRQAGCFERGPAVTASQ